MTDQTHIEVFVASPEEADDGIAEFWCDGEMMAMTCIDSGRLELRIEARRDGQPWRVDTKSLAVGLAEAARLLAAH
jgi:hypothetical protein